MKNASSRKYTDRLKERQTPGKTHDSLLGGGNYFSSEMWQNRTAFIRATLSNPQPMTRNISAKSDPVKRNQTPEKPNTCPTVTDAWEDL